MQRTIVAWRHSNAHKVLEYGSFVDSAILQHQGSGLKFLYRLFASHQPGASLTRISFCCRSTSASASYLVNERSASGHHTSALSPPILISIAVRLQASLKSDTSKLLQLASSCQTCSKRTVLSSSVACWTIFTTTPELWRTIGMLSRRIT